MRVFKTKWFSKAAKSHDIKDSELCHAIEAVVQGKADDPGGGVYRKRLNQNRDRDSGERRGALVLHVPLCQTG